MYLSALLSEIGVSLPAGVCDGDIGTLVADSRLADSSSLFVCVAGARDDGHSFAPSAYRRGCRTFFAERPLPLPDDASVIILPDTRASLADLSAAFYGYPARKLTLIGITGTKGKTTTALMTEHILNKAGKKCGYIGTSGIRYAGLSYPTVNTTPESIELHRVLRDMVDKGIGYCVCEVSSQALYMGRVRGICFDTVVFTNLSRDHIGGVEHPTYEHYAACKRTLFTSHGASRAVMNTDDGMAEYMADGFSGLTVTVSSSGAPADYSSGPVFLDSRPGVLGVKTDVLTPTGKYAFALSIPGDFNVSNALLATASASGYGVGDGEALEALSDLSIPGRFEIVGGNGTTFVIDYAHNGVSLTSALAALRRYSPRRLICLVGSVGDRTRGRRRELGEAACDGADFTIITSDNPGRENPQAVIDEIASCFHGDASKFITFTDRSDAVRYAVSVARPGDIVLLAGKGSEDYQLIGNVRVPYSDRACLEEALKTTV